MEETRSCKISSPTESAATSSAKREKLRRSTTGCLCCRVRKKKCDERRPVCLGCERNVLLCNWPSLKGENERRAPRKGSNPSRAAAGNSKPKAKASTEDRHRSQRSPSTVIEADEVMVDGEEGTEYVEQSDLQMSWRPSMTVSASIRPSDIYFASPNQQQLYQNFIKKTANFMSAWQDQANPFINFLIPMAASDDLLSQSIMTLSGAHLFYSESEHRNDKKMWSSEHEILLIRGLKFGITKYADNQRNALSLLISTLLLCLKETIITNSSPSVLIHLKATRELLLGWVCTPTARFEVGIRTFVIELYLYLAILLYIPLGLDLNPFIFEDSKTLFPYIRATEHSGTLLGCAHQLYELIPKISSLARDREAAVTAKIPITQDDYAAFAALLKEVVLWEPPAGAVPDFVQCGRIWQQAVLVFLYTSFMKFSDKPFDLPQLVDQVFIRVEAALGHLPFDAPISTTLNWPLAVLGSCASRSDHQNIIRRQLIGLGDRLQMGCFRQLLQVLENLWEGPRPKDGMMAFQEVMNEMNMIVLIV